MNAHEAAVTTSKASTSATNAMKLTGTHGDLYPLNTEIMKLNDNALFRHQGQKWDQFYDFERMLKQIRTCERQLLRSKSDSTTAEDTDSNSINARSLLAPTAAVSPAKGTVASSTASITTAASSCGGSTPIRQVQRLNGNDMHYYGIVPKQAPIDVIVCNICQGIYTKIGLSNHMSLQHPLVWAAISSKVTVSKASSGVDIIYNSLQATENTDISAPSDILGSPSDISGTMSTCSNASSSSSSSYAAINARHKSTKNCSNIGSSSSSSICGGNRSRSKSKHHSSSASTSSSSTIAVLSHASNRSMKKHSMGSVALPSAKDVAGVAIHTTKIEAVPVFTVSTSNSSCSLPPTGRPSHFLGEPQPAATIMPRQSGDKQSNYTLISVVGNKEKPRIDVAVSKKAHSAACHLPESVDSSNSSSEYDNVGFKLGIGVLPSDTKLERSTPLATGFKNQIMYNTQASQLDQAISSITGCAEDRLVDRTHNDIVGVKQSDRSLHLNKSKSSVLDRNICHRPITHFATFVAPANGTPVANDDVTPQVGADDNSILTLEDMLDPKFINEILNTAEAGMHFEEHELNGTAQQAGLQPTTKRMRYDGETRLVEQPLSDTTGSFAVFQPQQQPLPYARYNIAHQENVKVYSADEQMSLDSQYQTQLAKLIQQQRNDQANTRITTIDTTQLQQLLYQHQNMDVLRSNIEHQEQFEETKQLINLCPEDGFDKRDSSAATKLTEYTVIDAEAYETHANGGRLTSQYQLFDVPSLTDDGGIDDGVTAKSYLLPANDEQHLIYEIAANTQVDVMNQQRQQLTLAEFLTQTSYRDVPNSTETEPNGLQQQQKHEQCGIDSEDMMDFDYSQIEIVKSKNSANNSGTCDGGISNFQEDYYLNLFIYTGIPKPLAINSFGLIKLPQAAATTFRKNLFTARKANNSPITLNSTVGGMNGVARVANINAKTAANYFTALPSNGGNDFSIGSITISNAQISQQQQAALDMPSSGSHSSGSSYTPPTQQKGRSRSAVTDNAFGATSVSKNKIQAASCPPVAVIMPTSRMSERSSTSAQHRTILINNVETANDRRCVKRSLITGATDPNRKGPSLVSKRIADILSGNRHQPLLAADSSCQESDITVEEPNRTRYFYEHRKKLFYMANARQQQRRRTAFRRQLTALADCGFINNNVKPQVANSCVFV